MESTTLYGAIRQKAFDKALELLQLGADPNLRGASGAAPAHSPLESRLLRSHTTAPRDAPDAASGGTDTPAEPWNARRWLCDGTTTTCSLGRCESARSATTIASAGAMVLYQAASRLSRSQVALQDLSPSEAQARGPIVGLLLSHSAEIDPAQLAQMLGMGGSMDLTPQLDKHRQVCGRAVA